MDERSAPCKALVLAGGGARGSYQVGVWRALMELDWHPQIITGTSVGSLNGAMFVLDQYETARDMWLAIRSKDVMELPEEDADLSALHQFLRSVVKAGGMDVTPLEEIVERVLDEDALRAAPIRFGLVTVENAAKLFPAASAVSAAASPCRVSPTKSKNPGVSRRLILQPFHSTGAMAVEREMPRLTSSASKSDTVVPDAIFPGRSIALEANRMASVRLVLPSEPCPAIHTLRSMFCG